MSSEFTKTQFVADAIIAHIRAGFVPSNGDASRLDSRPLIDGLRSTITENDIPWILSLINSKSDSTSGLACSLLRNYALWPEVKRCFEARWHTASPYVKNRVMWRMLDDPDLPQALHSEFFNFIRAEWETFVEFNRSFYGDGKQGICNLISRIGDPSFPESKKWIYLCCAPGVIGDANASKALVSVGLLMNDPFAREVAATLLQEFLADSADESHQSQTESQLKQSAGWEFISDAVVSHLRGRHLPWEQEADYLNRVPLIDYLRLRITESDLPWILKVIDTRGEVGAFCLSLLRGFTKQSEIQQALREKWSTADAFFKAHLMWRLLDDPNLPSEWHKRLFGFVLEEWPTFKEVSLKFLGTPETVVSQALLRIGDATFPDSKKWAYLCRVPEAADNCEEAKALVTLGSSMSDPFCQEVAGVLLQRFFPSSHKEA